jgi:hypothetical protein
VALTLDFQTDPRPELTPSLSTYKALNMDEIFLKALDFQAAQRKRIHASVGDFVESLRSADSRMFYQALSALELEGALRIAFSKVATLKEISQEGCLLMLRHWIDRGDQLRQAISDDLLLCDAFRASMPRYHGGDLKIYRGETTWNRRRRRYGLSWTDDPSVAQGFAEGVTRTHEGGSVVLETIAPAQAIICIPKHHTNDPSDDYESEILVDRRCLKRVNVIRRLPQISFEELRLAAQATSANQVVVGPK